MGGLQYLQFCFQGFSTRHLHVLSKPNSSITIPAFNASFPPSHYIYASKSYSPKLAILPYSYSLNLSTTMSSLVYFLLCIYYLHACTGRPLAVFDQENSSKIQLSGKDMKTPGGQKPVVQGNEVKMTHFGKIFEVAPEKQEWKREGRLTLESPSKKAKKNMILKKSDSIEDIVVMDYAQPRRKPPIHNKEP